MSQRSREETVGSVLRSVARGADYRTTAIDHGARLGIDVHPGQRPPETCSPSSSE
ncbi:hypothetical protein ACFYZ5_46155 [Streptomyces chartreusis]|uniref:hypothetical protein n=1 Tax=Streptomyces chartreusis TaxID=1969 RepID=UPI0036CF429D